MDFRAYAEYVLRQLPPDRDPDRDLFNATLGLCGEAGEFADLVKKWAFQGHTRDDDALTRELGDVLFYLTLGAASLGVTLEQVAEANVAKLTARYPQGFSVAASVARADQRGE